MADVKLVTACHGKTCSNVLRARRTKNLLYACTRTRLSAFPQILARPVETRLSVLSLGVSISLYRKSLYVFIHLTLLCLSSVMRI